MFEIGASLRDARERRGISLDEAEDSTLVRGRYLAALEDERFEALPAPFYVRSFLREYADYLGLDGDLYVAEYLSRFGAEEPEPPVVPLRTLEPDLRRAVRPALVVAAVLVVLVAAWKLGGSSTKRTPVVTPPAASSRATTRPRPAPTTPAAVVPSKSPPAKAATLSLVAARGPCWLQVRVGSSSGPVAFERTLQTGERAVFGLARPLYLRLGAGWNVDASVAGKPAALPPGYGIVVARRSGLTSG